MPYLYNFHFKRLLCLDKIRSCEFLVICSVRGMLTLSYAAKAASIETLVYRGNAAITYEMPN
jgi:hypothetical protein